jgi:hypothetical protein
LECPKQYGATEGEQDEDACVLHTRIV